MTKNETLRILAIIKVAYPNSFTKMTNQDIEMLTNLWTMQFKEYEYELVMGAINTIIASDLTQFMPTIARVKQVCSELCSTNQISEYEAWNSVKQALSNSIYNAKDEFEKLPEICKEIVGNARQLREWCLLDTNELDTVVHSNFLKSFRSLSEHQRQQNLIPLTVKEKLMLESPKKELEGE